MSRLIGSAGIYGLERRIEQEPMPQLFDDPVAAWLPARSDHRRDGFSEIGHFLDRALATTIRKSPHLTASTLWRWITNVRREDWSELKKQTMEALSSWLDDDPGREIALFDEVLGEDRLGEGPWVVSNRFMRVVRKHPSAAVLRHLVDRARRTLEPERKERLFAIAVEIAVVSQDEASFGTHMMGSTSSPAQCY